MNLMEQINELEKQKANLLIKAKKEAMATIEKGISELAAIGWDYELVEKGTVTRKSTATGTRRQGIRSDVLNLITETGNGVSRAQLLEIMDAKGDKKAEQSISNALANLKKSGDINLNDGVYTVA